jgi:hypothetical protein
MGIFDAITGMAERHPDVSEEQHSSLLQGAMSMFGNSGGVSRLLNNAQSHGLGGIVQSWIGTGANQPIAEGQFAIRRRARSHQGTRGSGWSSARHCCGCPKPHSAHRRGQADTARQSGRDVGRMYEGVSRRTRDRGWSRGLLCPKTW